MTWFRVDDGFHSHPKVMATPPAALGLWVVAGSWSSAHLTDGVVPDDVLPRLLPDAAKLAEELVTAGLWRRRKGGYQFHDWKHRNPLRKEVLDVREKRAEAGRLGGLASGNARSKREANASPLAKDMFEPPTRPDPSVVEVVASTTGRPAPRVFKPPFSNGVSGAAARQPPPFAQANATALDPDGTRGRHARKDPPQ